MPYIHYPFWFQKSQKYVRALLNSGSKVNTINPAFTKKLGLHIRKINVRAKKIDGSTLETFEMVITDLEIEDKTDKSRFFSKNFFGSWYQIWGRPRNVFLENQHCKYVIW